MTTRTRAAKKTADPAPAPVKKATARKATTKKATPRPRKTTTKKTQPRLSLVKPTPGPELPSRTRPFMTDTQGHAVLAARIIGIPTHRIRDWRDHRDGTATRPLRDGSHLHYDHNTRTLTWQATCPQGAIHQYRLTSPSTAAAARVHADRCTTPHADLTHIPALTRDELAALGIHTGPTWARPDVLGEPDTQSIPIPLTSPGQRALADQLTHSGAGLVDTQSMSTTEIAAGLAARANQDAPKEHPQP